MNHERKLLLAIALLTAAACSTSSSSTMASAGAGPAPALDMSMRTPSPDPRVGLRAGTTDSLRHITGRAAESGWNLRLVSNTPSSAQFVGVTNSDLAFVGKYAIQGN